jgi:outer membrane protein
VFGADGAPWRSSRFRVGPTLVLDFGRDESDSPDLSGLGDVSTAVEVGLFASYVTERGRYRLRLRQDIASGHGGLLADADISRVIFRNARSSVASRLTTTWAGSKYMGAYFGVDPAQAAASGLPVFAAGSGFKDVSLTVVGQMRVSPRWTVVVNAAAQRLLGDAQRSPLVRLRGSAMQFSGGVYAVYAFE